MSSVLTNAMTIDVEDYFHVSAFADHVDRSSWPEFESRVVHNTEVTLKLLDDADVKATFFVLGMVAEQFPGLVSRIASAGHEIACHGYSHRLIYEQSRTEFEQETVKAKKMLEDLAGESVNGYRAASFSITDESEWALDVLCAAGFTYDSSIYPVHHDRYGIAGARRLPGQVAAPGGEKIVEFPPSTARWLGTNVPVAGGGYFRLFPYSLSRAGMRSINDRDRSPFVFYFHPWEIDPDQPRIDSSRFSRFRHYTNLDKTRSRLKQLMQDFEFGTMASVLRQAGLLK